ncbi:MAG TPA: 6-phosphogluconolactonase [Actinomycetes bacterium]|nr:6-phosphogluconolactonase [Actinomycetes bacterium]
MAAADATLQVLDDPAAVALAAAQATADALAEAVERRGSATWALTGGSTPLAAYRLLAAGTPGPPVPWPRLRLAMGDERLVPEDDPGSNWGQAAAALLDHVPVPPAGRLQPRTWLPPEEAAADYERRLRALPAAASGWPLLDLVWLGVGEDGHCLSLFPGHPELDVTDRLVVAVRGAPKPPPDRISLTLPALRGTAGCLVVAVGAGKAAALARALAGDRRLPVSRAVAEVAAAGGSVTWLLDRAAAGG